MRTIDRTGTFSRLQYSCMKTVLEVVHHVQLTAKNFNSISLIYFIYYWQVIHTQWLLNPRPHSTPYSYKGGGAIWTRAIWQTSNTPSLYVASLGPLKLFLCSIADAVGVSWINHYISVLFLALWTGKNNFFLVSWKHLPLPLVLPLQVGSG